MFIKTNLINFSKYNKKINYAIIGIMFTGYITVKTFKYLRYKYFSSEKKIVENPVESELRDFLLKDNQVCSKCDSLNRNIMNNPDLKCWNCDSTLNQKDHPTITIN